MKEKIVSLGDFIETYEPTPRDRKSFYGKAHVLCFTDGFLLKSYNTYVLAFKKSSGVYYRLWDSFSATTGRHIACVSGLNKSAYTSLKNAHYLRDGDLIVKGSKNE